MELVYAYAAGLLTLINPCVLPILPIIVVGSLQASPRGPVYMAAGMSVTFVAFGMFVNTIGYAIGLDDQTLAQAGALVMVAFGLILVVPRFSAAFSTATAGFAARADTGLDRIDAGSARGQFLTGALLGVVWSPCIGPTLGSAIGLASQGQNLTWAALIMVAFALGVSTLILALGYGARQALQARLRRIAERARPLMGAIFLIVGLSILTGLTHRIEALAVTYLPAWVIDLSVAL